MLKSKVSENMVKNVTTKKKSICYENMVLQDIPQDCSMYFPEYLLKEMRKATEQYEIYMTENQAKQLFVFFNQETSGDFQRLALISEEKMSPETIYCILKKELDNQKFAVRYWTCCKIKEKKLTVMWH